VIASGEETQAQIERILQSTTFRNTEALKRLLRYLADKSLAGEADQIKEYTLAVDALGKPPSYDPRQDSQVRIQVGRLRQKLAEYYQSEGQHDTIVVTLPKGRFVLQATPSSRQEREAGERLQTATKSKPATPSLGIVIAFAAALILCAAWAIYATVELRNERKTEASRAQWTADMDELWRPLINSRRPLLVSVSSPLFVGLQGSGMFRDRSANTWEEALRSPAVAAVRKGLNNPQIVSRYYYTGFGNMEAIFQLGKLFAGKDLHVSIVKSQDLSWRELTDNNVILVGSLERFAEQTPNMPAELDLGLKGASVPPDAEDDPAGGPEDPRRTGRSGWDGPA